MRNKAFDKEYSTQWPLEQMYLKENGIPYSFVKIEGNVTIWKYTKTAKLFEILNKFYSSIEKSRTQHRPCDYNFGTQNI